MTDAQRRIEALSREYVERLQEIARDELLHVLGGQGRGRASTSSRSKKLAANGAGRARGAKRDTSELDKLGEKFLSFVSKHPGLRIEQINAELGTGTKNLALPIKKLLAAKAVRTTGTRRATKYYLASSGKKRGAGKAAKTRTSKRVKR